MAADNKLTFGWVKVSDGVALVFDTRTWNAFERVAKIAGNRPSI